MLLVVCCRYSLIANVVFALGLVDKLDGKGVRVQHASYIQYLADILTVRLLKQVLMSGFHFKMSSQVRLCVYRRLFTQYAGARWDSEYVQPALPRS